jgi:uncharacterized protein YndB with AHSA1/START domain
MATESARTKDLTVGKTHIVVEPGRQETEVRRLFDVPREKLFRVMNDAQHIPEWWGPANLKTTVEQYDAKPGGSWRILQQDEDGSLHGFRGVFHDVQSPARMVLTFEYEGMPGHVSMQTFTFEDLNGKTLLREHTVFQSVADRDGMVQAGMEVGINSTMQRLDKILGSLQ